MSEYSNFGLGPIKGRVDAAGFGWLSIADQAYNAMVRILSPCSEWDLIHESPKDKWKRLHREQRLRAKKMWKDCMEKGVIGSIYGARFVSSCATQDQFHTPPPESPVE